MYRQQLGVHHHHWASTTLRISRGMEEYAVHSSRNKTPLTTFSLSLIDFDAHHEVWLTRNIVSYFSYLDLHKSLFIAVCTPYGGSWGEYSGYAWLKITRLALMWHVKRMQWLINKLFFRQSACNTLHKARYTLVNYLLVCICDIVNVLRI